MPVHLICKMNAKSFLGEDEEFNFNRKRNYDNNLREKKERSINPAPAR